MNYLSAVDASLRVLDHDMPRVVDELHRRRPRRVRREREQDLGPWVGNSRDFFSKKNGTNLGQRCQLK